MPEPKSNIISLYYVRLKKKFHDNNCKPSAPNAECDYCHLKRYLAEPTEEKNEQSAAILTGNN